MEYRNCIHHILPSQMFDKWFKRVTAGCVSISNNDEVKFHFCVQLIFLQNLTQRNFSEYKGKKKLSLHKFVVAVFPSTFLQSANCSKKSILNWVYETQVLYIHFFFFVFDKPLKDFPFYSTHKGKLNVSFLLNFLQNSPLNSESFGEIWQ